jgi:hypothetical protein
VSPSGATAITRHGRTAIRTHTRSSPCTRCNNDYAARLQGAQIAYDVGIQRTCWQLQSLTNWAGDAGEVKSIHGQYRSHVYLSDVIRLGGRVTEKEIKNGEAVVTIETWATNQRDQNVMPGSAVVALPRRLRPVVTLIPLEDNVKEK